MPGVRLDDHRGWIERMRVMGRGAMVVGMAVLALVITATVLSVAFATRGAMASNRPTIEVLHLVGAKEGFYCQPIPVAFPAARSEGRGGRRGRGNGLVCCRPAVW